MPALLQSLIVLTFENNGHIGYFSRDTGGVETNYVLESDIREFQARYAGYGEKPAVVVVSLAFSLVAFRGQRIVSRRLFSRETQVPRNTVVAVVQGFDAASSAVLARGVLWALQALRPNPA